MPFRILYLWNTAGALTPVSEWLVQHGHESIILMNSQFDIYGQTSCSQTSHMVHSSKSYYLALVKILLTFQPTHIHVNSHLPSLVIARLLHPFTPIVFHYHGVEVRFREKRHDEMALADKVIVSTPDLEKYGEWYDRPVDSRFTYKGGRIPGTAVMFYVSYYMKDLRQFAKKWCEDRGIKLTIMSREKGDVIPYSQMPEFLSRFEYYLDFKGYGHEKALSRLAIEALACGTKVVSDLAPDVVITEYDFFSPEKYLNLYRSLKGNRRGCIRSFKALAMMIRWIYSRVLARTFANKAPNPL